ncbi:hypothetical protein GCN78_28050 [Janthinobacterium rivuli]|nr:hypothetical protein GCN78_28050 [Janthinobacterium sp. FT68W]
MFILHSVLIGNVRCHTPDEEHPLTQDIVSAVAAFDGATRLYALSIGDKGQDLSSVLSYDYKAKKAVAASVPTNMVLGGKNAPMLESYDTPGQYWYANGAQAQRYAQLQMQAHEARAQLWQARSTVRTLRAGTRFTLTQGPLQAADGAAPEYVVLRVASIGVNNLPAPAREGLAELFGPIPELLEETVAEWGAGFPDFAAAIVQAQASGYANCLEMITAATPWRPVHDDNEARQHATPTAPGSQSAIVVGADGNDVASGTDEIYCDKLGRVRIRFHWQREMGATCWVRVAGGGMGSQFLPRIGQEVLVQFLENDIDQPVIIGALYNGQGEGGTLPIPGGMAGYNQLLFDDTDSQGRVQLKSSHAYPLPALPASVCKACLLAALRSGSPFIAPTAA